ncbi:hypothetical protein FGIG_08262 [Fasciola gigantica]|uniref:Transmembrane protein n=1 Tax=Fasciola gigantica TaxID=46835 RepID=A0A504YR00_FASGI|nr:hypothetical protein FGIG_08262 [Fasciola gigantica]
MSRISSLVLLCIYLSLIRGTTWSPAEIVVDSTSELSLNSVPQVVCLKLPDTFGWPVYMLRDVLFTLTLQTPAAGHMDEIRPISPLVSVTIRDLMLHNLPDRIEDVPSLCMPDSASSASVFSLDRFLSLFHSPTSDVRKTLTTIDEVNFTLPAFPYPCLAVCPGTNNPFIPLRLIINSTSAFNEVNVFKCAFGVWLLIYADYLSQAVSFYYFSGISMAVFGSLIIAVLLIIRMLPLRRSGTVLQGLFILLGSTFSLSCMLLEYVRSTIFTLLAANVEYTTVYVVAVALLSFVFLYWFHLPDLLISRYPRTLIVMKYSLRLIGATLVMYSLYLPFDETRLGYFLLSMVSSQLSWKTDQTQVWSPTMTSNAPRMIRLLFAGCLVLLVDLCDCWHLVPSENRRKRRKSGWLPSVESDNPIFANAMPGSPWASSSPYGEAVVPSPRYQSRSRNFTPDFVPRSSRGNFASRAQYYSSKNYGHGNRRSVGPYENGYYHSPSASYDILTDDEED